MKIKCQGCVGSSSGYYSGGNNENFSEYKIKNLANPNSYFEKIKEENLEKNLKNFISYIRK